MGAHLENDQRSQIAEIVSQTWITTGEAATLWRFMFGEEISTSTLGRWCRDERFVSLGIEVRETAAGYRLSVPDILAYAHRHLADAIAIVETLDALRADAIGGAAAQG